jgi:hypothetical protein
VTQNRLPDRWHTRDFPALLEAAGLLDAGEMPVSSDDIAANLGCDEDDVIAPRSGPPGCFSLSVGSRLLPQQLTIGTW